MYNNGVPSFKPYRGSDAVGYVTLSTGAKAILWEYSSDQQTLIGEKYYVELLGWGETFGGFLGDYSREDQTKLKMTLVREASNES